MKERMLRIHPRANNKLRAGDPRDFQHPAKQLVAAKRGLQRTEVAQNIVNLIVLNRVDKTVNGWPGHDDHIAAKTLA